ncbi:sulfate transmembrane transporter [Actinidia rufa]|uniref:Sulfate transmembrane transporter n=1 Tax=Actinidia rufa TaxID=165716 RepID=A0A7J0EJN2_9ERIC|nr:sulfate transmembrane transporter [Actinidia rufa]
MEEERKRGKERVMEEEHHPPTHPLLQGQRWRHHLATNLRLKTTSWSELGGAMGDLGTYIPIILSLALVSYLDLSTTPSPPPSPKNPTSPPPKLPPQECPPLPPSSSLAPPLTLEERGRCGWVVFFLHGPLFLHGALSL